MNFSWNPKDFHNRYELYIAWWNRTQNSSQPCKENVDYCVEFIETITYRILKHCMKKLKLLANIQKVIQCLLRAGVSPVAGYANFKKASFCIIRKPVF